MIRYRAPWVVPISRPSIRDGTFTVEQGRLVSVDRSPIDDGLPVVDLGEVVVLPGLVNAHTHLELSYLRHEVPPASSFVRWIRAVVEARKQRPDPASPEILGEVERGIAEALECGTAVVGDISNTLVTFPPLARSPLAALVFYELIRFKTDDPDGLVEEARRQIEALGAPPRVRGSLAAHAPYSVAPLVFRAIRKAIDAGGRGRSSVHLSESAEEVEFIRDASGPWRRLLEELGAWDPAWVAPGVSPVEYLDAIGFLDSRVNVVHGVQMTAADLSRLAARQSTLVTCPRSNRYTGAGRPPVEQFYRSGVPVAVGTDSLASAPDLNVFAELKELRALAPQVPARLLLDSATRQGARALGFDEDYGTIDAGKRARLVAVAVPPGVSDVEEYLLTGICPEQIRWIE